MQLLSNNFQFVKMKFHQYFIVLIFTLCLILNVNAQANAIKLSAVYKGEPCANSFLIANSPVASTSSADDNTSECVVAKPYNDTFSITCKPDTPLASNLTLTWFMNSSPVVLNERINTYNGENSSVVLQFSPVIPDDMGRYECRAVKKDTPNSTPERTIAIMMQVLPYVKYAHKDFTVVEENPINITCTVLSKKPTTVMWRVKTNGLEKNFTSSEGRIILSKINDTTNAMLHIKSANLSLDRGTYECVASSEVGESATIASFMIRLKSKYAALWPLLGIVAEVILLCAIILIYEKKRDKSEMEESDTDQGPETKSSPDHGQDGVRYRK